MFFTPVIRRSALVSTPRPTDRSFERFVQEALSQPSASRRTPLVAEDEKSWSLQLDVPGLAREQLTIGIDGAVLRIDSATEAPRTLHLAYELPQEIDAATSSAKLENGVLNLTLGKLTPVSHVTQLAIS
jgi:HSP20 family protein